MPLLTETRQNRTDQYAPGEQTFFSVKIFQNYVTKIKGGGKKSLFAFTQS